MTIENFPQHIRNEWDTAKPIASGVRFVRTFDGIGVKPGGDGFCAMSEPEFIEVARLRLMQNNAGQFTPQDVAAILAASQNWVEQTQREFLWHLHKDIRRGDIRIIKDAHMLERNCAIDGDKHSDAHDLLSTKEIARWLEAQNAPYTFPAESFSHAPTKSTQAVPVVDGSDGTTPLTTSQIAGCFAGFHNWDATKWKTNLQSPASWLKACQHQAGRQGKPIVETTWLPVQIAQALDAKHPNIRRKLHARFKNQEPLKPWLESLETYLPDNSET